MRGLIGRPVTHTQPRLCGRGRWPTDDVARGGIGSLRAPCGASGGRGRGGPSSDGNVTTGLRACRDHQTVANRASIYKFVPVKDSQFVLYWRCLSQAILWIPAAP
eukprot:6899469-Prymnesium_polylepis.1